MESSFTYYLLLYFLSQIINSKYYNLEYWGKLLTNLKFLATTHHVSNQQLDT